MPVFKTPKGAEFWADLEAYWAERGGTPLELVFKDGRLVRPEPGVEPDIKAHDFGKRGED